MLSLPLVRHHIVTVPRPDPHGPDAEIWLCGLVGIAVSRPDDRMYHLCLPSLEASTSLGWYQFRVKAVNI